MILGEQFTVDGAATGTSARIGAEQGHHFAADIALEGFRHGKLQSLQLSQIGWQ
jgi:hypothetical protein